MKGIVFTEFLTMVEDTFGFNVADKIVKEAELESGGVYTSVGTYSHSEIVQLVSNLSEEKGIPVPDLLEAFGKYLFPRFVEGYKDMLSGFRDSFTLLEHIESHIHVEVKKLYPDAELPNLEADRTSDKKLTLTYLSTRKMSRLAVGLIKACGEHFQEDLSVQEEAVVPDGSVVKILVTKN